MENAQLVKRHTYSMNPKYTQLVKEVIQKLLDVRFIYPIKHTSWASLVRISKKKNAKIMVWIYFKKVSDVT